MRPIKVTERFTNVFVAEASMAAASGPTNPAAANSSQPMEGGVSHASPSRSSGLKRLVAPAPRQGEVAARCSPSTSCGLLEMLPELLARVAEQEEVAASDHMSG